MVGVPNFLLENDIMFLPDSSSRDLVNGPTLVTIFSVLLVTSVWGITRSRLEEAGRVLQ